MPRRSTPVREPAASADGALLGMWPLCPLRSRCERRDGGTAHGEHTGDVAAIIARNAELEAQIASAFLRGQENMRERTADIAYSEPVRRELILKMPLLGDPDAVPAAKEETK